MCIRDRVHAARRGLQSAEEDGDARRGDESDDRRAQAAQRAMDEVEACLLYTSALAPTSMPRVGSSRISRSGCVAIQRARMTFCWLPPESSPIFFSASGVAMAVSYTHLDVYKRQRWMCRA